MIFYKFALLLAVAIGSISSLKTVTKNGKVWRFVGYVDGKVYMAEINKQMSWEAAAKYCEENEMHMASITSEAQANEIDNAYDPWEFSGQYWTSARDAMNLRQYSWNDTNDQPSDDYLIFYGTYAKINSCLFLHSDGVPGLYVHPDDCNNEHLVLCEESL